MSKDDEPTNTIKRTEYSYIDVDCRYILLLMFIIEYTLSIVSLFNTALVSTFLALVREGVSDSCINGQR